MDYLVGGVGPAIVGRQDAAGMHAFRAGHPQPLLKAQFNRPAFSLKEMHPSLGMPCGGAPFASPAAPGYLGRSEV
jgi:hypothetical protein